MKLKKRQLRQSLYYFLFFLCLQVYLFGSIAQFIIIYIKKYFLCLQLNYQNIRARNSSSSIFKLKTMPKIQIIDKSYMIVNNPVKYGFNIQKIINQIYGFYIKNLQYLNSQNNKDKSKQNQSSLLNTCKNSKEQNQEKKMRKSSSKKKNQINMSISQKCQKIKLFMRNYPQRMMNSQNQLKDLKNKCQKIVKENQILQIKLQKNEQSLKINSESIKQKKQLEIKLKKYDQEIIKTKETLDKILKASGIEFQQDQGYKNKLLKLQQTQSHANNIIKKIDQIYKIYQESQPKKACSQQKQNQRLLESFFNWFKSNKQGSKDISTTQKCDKIKNFLKTIPELFQKVNDDNKKILHKNYQLSSLAQDLRNQLKIRKKSNENAQNVIKQKPDSPNQTDILMRPQKQNLQLIIKQKQNLIYQYQNYISQLKHEQESYRQCIGKLKQKLQQNSMQYMTIIGSLTQERDGFKTIVNLKSQKRDQQIKKLKIKFQNELSKQIKEAQKMKKQKQQLQTGYQFKLKELVNIMKRQKQEHEKEKQLLSIKNKKLKDKNFVLQVQQEQKLKLQQEKKQKQKDISIFREKVRKLQEDKQKHSVNISKLLNTQEKVFQVNGLKKIKQNFISKIEELQKLIQTNDKKFKQAQRLKQLIKDKENYKKVLAFDSSSQKFPIQQILKYTEEINPEKQAVAFVSLIYKYNKDYRDVFSKKTTDKKNLFIIAKTVNGQFIGGFTSHGFGFKSEYKNDGYGFLFSTDKINKINFFILKSPQKIPSQNFKDQIIFGYRQLVIKNGNQLQTDFATRRHQSRGHYLNKDKLSRQEFVRSNSQQFESIQLQDYEIYELKFDKQQIQQAQKEITQIKRQKKQLQEKFNELINSQQGKEWQRLFKQLNRKKIQLKYWPYYKIILLKDAIETEYVKLYKQIDQEKLILNLQQQNVDQQLQGLMKRINEIQTYMNK